MFVWNIAFIWNFLCASNCLAPHGDTDFVKIDHELFSIVILLLSLIQEGLRKYVQQVLVNRLVKLAQEKVF